MVIDALEGLCAICPIVPGAIDADLAIALEGLLDCCPPLDTFVFGVLWRDVIDPLLLSFWTSSRNRRFSTARLFFPTARFSPL